MGLYHKLKEKWILLGQNIYEGQRLTDNLRDVSRLGVIIVAFSSIMAGLYFHQGYPVQGLITSGVILGGLLIFIFAHFFHNRMAAMVCSLVMCLSIFTYNIVTGVLSGYTTTWTFIIPVAFCYFFSVKYGILLSFYYWLLYVVLFYTPLREYMSRIDPSFYTVAIMNRLPVQYTCITVITALSMIQYHRGVLLRVQYERDLEVELRKQSSVAAERLSALGELTNQVIFTLAATIDAKDKYTTGHSIRVGEYACRLARAAGFSDAQAEDLRLEALLHDVGKIGVPDVVLNKSASLSDAENLVLKAHTSIGADILKKLTRLPDAGEVALRHHERYDGKGYPDGLKGEEIPLHARIVTIADAYDAMHSDRIYRHSLTADKIRKELQKGRGTQFDPELLDVFLGLLDAGELYDVVHTAVVHTYRLQDDVDAAEYAARCAEALRKGQDGESEIEILRNNKAFCTFVLRIYSADSKKPIDDTEADLSDAFLFAINKVLEESAVCEPAGVGRYTITMRKTTDADFMLMRRKVYAEFFCLTNSERYELRCTEL